MGVAERRALAGFVSQQVHYTYTLQAREAEYELLPIAVDRGLGVLVWSPLAGGLLSGKCRRGEPPPAGSRLLAGWDEPPVRDQDKLYDIVDVLVAVAKDRGASPAQVALAWLLERPAVTSLVVGARTGEQLADNLGTADLSLLGPTSPADRQLTRRRDLLLLGGFHPARVRRAAGGRETIGREPDREGI